MEYKNIFDADRMNRVRDIYYVNRFVWENLTYDFFSFNDHIFKVMNPHQFKMEDAKTEIEAVKRSIHYKRSKYG